MAYDYTAPKAAVAAINKAIEEINDKYMVERSRKGTAYFVVNFYKLKDGGIEVRIYEAPEDYPAEVIATKATNGDPMLQVPLPQYEDVPQEDVWRHVGMDLSFIVSRWLADLQSQDYGRKGSANLTPEERKERARKAARKRWGSSA